MLSPTSQSVSQSVSSRGDCAHHTTVSKGGSAPLGQHKYMYSASTRSFRRPSFAGLLNYSLCRYRRSVLPSTHGEVVIPCARCPILPGGIVIGNQVWGLGGRGEGGSIGALVGFRALSTVINSSFSSAVVVLPQARRLYGPCVCSASVNHVDHPRAAPTM